MKLSRAVPALVVVLMLLPALALVLGPAGGQIPPGVKFTEIRDYPLDTNDNVLYDQLVIAVSMELSQSGTYSFVCDLSVNASGNWVRIDSIVSNETLDRGSGTVELIFDSEVIFRKGLSGVYRAHISVMPFDPLGREYKITHLTTYNHTEFEAPENPPPVPPDAPVFELDLYYVNVTTSVFQVFVNRSSPEIIFRYREHRPRMPDFKVTYSRLILFEDDGDHMYDGEVPMASVMLTNHPWGISNIDVSGPRVSFDLKAMVPIPKGDDFISVSMTLTFTVTNGSVADPDNSPFIRGDASELKVDIRLEMEEPLPPADHLALESQVTDTLGSHGFLVEEPVGYHFYPRTEETSYLPVPRLPNSRHTIVGQASDDLVLHSFVGWMNVAQETWSEGGPVDVDVAGSFRVKGGQMELFLSYPWPEDLSVLDHDPSVGVISENLPPPPPQPVPEPEATPNIWVYLFAIVAGGVIILLTIYIRAQGY